MAHGGRIHGWTVVTDEDTLTPGALDRAWDAPSSVLLAPLRRGVDERWFSRAIEAIPPELAEGHYALLTSGSTGEPKLIVGQRQRTERLAAVIHEAQRNQPVERAVVLLPLTYSYAFVNQWVWGRVQGRAVELTRGAAELPRVLDVLRDGAPAMVCLVGPLFTLIAQSMRPGERLESVVRVNFAGGAFPHGQLEAVRAAFPNAEIINNYGCAEALPRLTITPAAQLEAVGDIGVPLRGVSLRVDEDGELRFKSEYGAVGVVEAGSFRGVGPDDWLSTQDLAEERNGRYRLVGRRSEVYKRYGEKVSVSQQLQAVREVWSGQAATLPDRDGQGEAGHVLVLSPAPTDEALRAVLKVFRARFPRAHWPLRVESAPQIPVSSNGKIDLAALASAERQVHWKQPA